MIRSLKEKMLVISHKVPQPDTSSADLRLYSILRILAAVYEITFIAPSSGAEDDVYVSLLKRHGILVHTERFSFKSLLKTEKFTVAIMEYYFTAESYLDRIRILQPECRVVVDSVDVHYLRLQLKYDLTKEERDRAIYLETKERELKIYSKADAVITVTGDDASALLREDPDIYCEVVPNIHEICLSDFLPQRDTLIFVGTFHHDPNIDAVLYFCREILPLLRNDKPDIHFTIIGGHPPEQIRMLESEGIKVTGYVPTTSSYLHGSCVSVAPLRYGAGMKGKIGEAMAHGVPVVTTSVGAQGMGLTDRKNVMIADSPQCFAAAVLELLDDSSLHATIRNNALQIITDNYTPERVAQSMSVALQRICERPVKKLNLRDKVVFFNNYISQRVRAGLSSH